MGGVEYHSKDFNWEEHKQEIENNPLFSFHLYPPIPPLLPLPSSSLSPSNAWSLFHSCHSTGKFFKERRYLLNEFPELLSCNENSIVLEVGCGNGSTILPILSAKEKVNVYACDCSAEALERAKENLENADVVGLADRFHPFCCDFSSSRFPTWLVCDSCRNFYSQKSIHHYVEGDNDQVREMGAVSLMKETSCCLGGVDFVTLIFTLSAVPPERMPAALTECFSALKPGGLLFFRDYGLYDMTMLRFEPEKRVGFRHYMRADGTYSYFFDLSYVRDLFTRVGFIEVELEYCCINSINRRKGKTMKRVWVHGKFRKPL